MDIDILKQFFDKISPIPADEWTKYAPHCHSQSYSKNQFIVRSGEYSPYLCLIVNGLIKRSYTSESGKEYVHYFGRGNDLTGTFTSIINKQPARVDIIAIKETQVIHFNYEKYTQFFDMNRSWERISRVLLEKHFLKREQREYQLLMMNAQDRYKAFLQEYHDCVGDLASKDIASFLGITAEGFSRLKKTINS